MTASNMATAARLRARTFLVSALVVLIGLMTFCAEASAQACSVSMTQLSFGTVALKQSGPVSSTANVNVSCSGLPNQTIRVCPSLTTSVAGGMTGSQLTAVGNVHSHVDIMLFADQLHSVPWRTGIDVPLDGRGNGTARQTIYGVLTASRGGSSAGQYHASLAVTFAASYLSGGALCSGALSTLHQKW